MTKESHKIFNTKKLEGEFQNTRGQWPIIQLAKACELYGTLVESSVTRADVVGFCEGGVTATILASVHPEAVSRLVLVNPAGMTDEDNSDRLLGRFKDKNRRYASMILRDIINGNVSESTYKMVKSSINRLLGMSALASLADIRIADTLKDLSNKGIKVSVVHSKNDQLYPYGAVNKNIPVELHSHASFADPLAGHAVFDSHTDDAVDAVMRLLEI